MPSKNGSLNEVETKVLKYWGLLTKVYQGISITQTVTDLNDAFIDYFGLITYSGKLHNKPFYNRCFKIKDTLHTIRWSLDSQDNKIVFSNIGKQAFDIMICKIDTINFTHKSSRQLLYFIMNEIPNEGLYILEKLIYGKV